MNNASDPQGRPSESQSSQGSYNPQGQYQASYGQYQEQGQGYGSGSGGQPDYGQNGAEQHHVQPDYGQFGQSQQQPAYGQSQYGQPNYSQSGYSQQESEQSSYRQSGYAQSQYGQPGQTGYEYWSNYYQPYSGQPGYPQGQPYAPQYGQSRFLPYGYQPRNKIAAGFLGIFLGCLGVHNFYLGFYGKAVAQLLLTLLGWPFLGLGPIASFIWGLIEGVLILSSNYGSPWHRDAKGVELRE
ncbi:TM2 domain-containing protein [Bifidobacterium sp. ESL0745]|uniref:TM2 domain-containing protein n=1 Tax=Bifidobacterium sp. ESL0745 TaxID=2983226 RepID=UPI0023F66DA5|nr:TM2 domain-containing protein [Bifidobacterium sp. ESL0745]MDF7665562.1 NINE protein [Bifidobacterium sp. ESL0745]